MTQITKEEIDNFKEMMNIERRMLDKIYSSNEDILNVFYNDKAVAIQFRNGKSITNDYLESLHELIDYESYSITIATVTEEFLKLKYTEDVLQLNIIL